MSQSQETGKSPATGGFESSGPNDLLSRQDLTREQKIETLRQWELDLRERMVAEEENMPASEPVSPSLQEVLEALRSLGAESECRDVTTKHG